MIVLQFPARREMFDNLREDWAEFRDDEPGRRFQNRFERRQESRKGVAGRAVRIALGIVIFAAGIFFLPAPGPGMVVLVIGAGLVAQEWRVAAKGLDRAEVVGRRLLAWAREFWDGSGVLVKALLVVLGVALAAGAAYVAWRVLFPNG